MKNDPNSDTVGLDFGKRGPDMPNDAQLATLRAVQELTDKDGHPPSKAALATHVGTSQAAIESHLSWLTARGFIAPRSRLV